MFVFSAVSVAFVVYVIWREVNFAGRIKKEIAFLEHFDLFLSHVRHFYYYSGSVADAIFYSISKSDKELRPALEELINALEKGNAAEYRGTGFCGEHRYMRLFASLAFMVTENGDTDEGESAFSGAVMQLRSDIGDDRRHIENKRHRYVGLGLTAALPVIAVPFIAAWGSRTIPSLAGFYHSRTGNVILCAILAISWICYNGILKLREDGRENNKRIFPEGIGKYLPFAAALLMTVVLCSGHHKTSGLLLKDTGDIESISQTADGRQLQAIKEVIPKYMKDFTERKIIPDEEVLQEQLLQEPGIRTAAVAEDASAEIIRRLNKYYAEKFDLPDMLIVVFTFMAVYCYPKFKQLFYGMMLNNRMQDEIMRFQSLIHMQKRVPGISPVMILESMENFSDVFRPALQQCINEYGINDTEALEHMARTERNPGFVRIADCFLAVDEAGTEAAFDEISSEIENFRENRKQERNIRLDENILLASLLAVLPGGLILFGYLLIPFMVRALDMFDMYQNTLSDYIRRQ